jgi:hypothetical protein
MEEVNNLPGRERCLDMSNLVYAVLQTVYPNLEISQKGISTANAFLNAALDHLMTEADRLARLQGTFVITEEILTEVIRTQLTGELAKLAEREGTVTLEKWRKCKEEE